MSLWDIRPASPSCRTSQKQGAGVHGVRELSLYVTFPALLGPLSPKIPQIFCFSSRSVSKANRFFLPSRALMGLANQRHWSSSLLRPRARPSTKPCRKLTSNDYMVPPQPTRLRLRLSHKQHYHLQNQMG